VATAQAATPLRIGRAVPGLALAAGGTSLLLLAVAVAAAHPETSPLSPDHPGGDTRWSWLYLGAIAASFGLYILALVSLARRAARLAPVLVVAVLVQAVPLAGPVLLSTDAYTYWAYGRVGAVHGGNPYADPPSRFPDDPAYARMGEDWRDTTTVYGPGFTLASEAHAAAASDSPAAASWAYRALGAAAILAIVGLVAILAPRPAFAVAFVGWNPLVAVHFSGGGHNDSWMMALVLAALACAATGRRQLAGVAWAGAIAVKWIPAVFLVLRALEARAVGRPVRHLGFAVTAAVLAGLAFWRYGNDWIEAVVPLARNLEKQAVYSIPHRLSDLGVPEQAAAILFGVLFGLAFLWLCREAWRGRARLGLAACLLLVATPWLVPWYAIWALPLAAVEEDRTAQLLALALSGYLLRDAVPL
jgi:alpha-1,6-mannosyltransferase